MLPTMAKGRGSKGIPSRPDSGTQQSSVMVAKGQMFMGPLPPPESLRHYNDILPGAAERILTMAEQQAAHRQTLEAMAVRTEARNSTLGVVFALLIGLGSMAVAGYAISQGKEISGTILGGTGLASLVGTFIYGTSQRRKERQAKFQKMQ